MLNTCIHCNSNRSASENGIRVFTDEQGNSGNLHGLCAVSRFNQDLPIVPRVESHSQRVQTKSSAPAESMKAVPATTKLYKCHYPQCTKVYISNSSLQVHTNSVHLGLKYVCPHGDAAYTHPSGILQHLKQHRPEIKVKSTTELLRPGF